MARYEHVFLVRQDASSSQVEALTARFKNVLSENGGSVGKTEYWGLKSLAYRIRKNRKAHYSLMNIEAPNAAVAEMERQMRINEDVIRFMTVKVDEHEEEPSVMMRSRSARGDREDRPRRKIDDDRPPHKDDADEEVATTTEETKKRKRGGRAAGKGAAAAESAEAQEPADGEGEAAEAATESAEEQGPADGGDEAAEVATESENTEEQNK